MVHFPFMLLFSGDRDSDTVCPHWRTSIEVSVRVIGKGGVPGTDFMRLGYLIPNTWGLVLHTNALNGWAITPQVSRYNSWWCWGCVWPSRHFDVMAMMHRHNIEVFWGPYTSSTPPKIIPACSGGCCPSIWCIGPGCKASCGAPGCHFRLRRP
jgi:hypothetical protein